MSPLSFITETMSIKKLNTSRPSGKMLIVAAVTAVLVIGVGAWALSYIKRPVIDLKGQRDALLYIPTGSDFDDVCQLLSLDGWLTDEHQFRTIAGLKHYADKVKPGRYRITDRMTANELVNRLRSGVQEPVKVTFNNIRTLEQLASSVSRHLEADSASILAAMRDTSLLVKYGYDSQTLPSMFIPNTYEFVWNTSGEQWMERMNREYDKFWTDKRQHKADSLHLTRLEVATIASIIEEETNKVDELPIIAGIYINRLRKGMLLQACPTLKYALGDFTLRRILKKDQQVESPYNTYKYAGLPPGPIRIPSITAVDAVLNAADHQYLFMCARPDGSGRHNFARTNAEHARNAAIYQKELDKRKIYR